MAMQNNPNNRQQKPKKKGSGLWGLLILGVIWLINRVDAGDISRFFSRLRWMIRTGSFRLDDAAIVMIAVIVAVIVLAVTLSRVKKVRAAKRFDGIKARGGGTAAADEAFTLLMGDMVAPRKEYIEKHAKYVQNLDI